MKWILVFACVLVFGQTTATDCTRYLSSTGIDSPTCGGIEDPCKTLKQTLSSSNCPSIIVLVASGVYGGSENQHVALLSTSSLVIKAITPGTVSFDSVSSDIIYTVSTTQSVTFEGIKYTPNLNQVSQTVHIPYRTLVDEPAPAPSNHTTPSAAPSNHTNFTEPSPSPASLPSNNASSPVPSPSPHSPAPEIPPSPHSPAPEIAPSPHSPAPEIPPSPHSPTPEIPPSPHSPAPEIPPSPHSPTPEIPPSPHSPAPEIAPSPSPLLPSPTPSPSPEAGKPPDPTAYIIGGCVGGGILIIFIVATAIYCVNKKKDRSYTPVSQG